MLSQGELQRLVALYDLEQYLFGEVSLRFASDGTLGTYDFYAIVIWKSNRSKTRIKDGLAEAGLSPEDLMRKVYGAETNEARVDTLTDVQGIGLPIASAILAVCYPKEFTVLDSRVWEALGAIGARASSAKYPSTTPEYIQYCQLCCRLAEQEGLTLRELDQALWAWSWEQDLLKLANEQEQQLSSLSDPEGIRDHTRPLTGRDLLRLGIVGLWADRQDIGDSLEFARKLRYEAGHRRRTPDIDTPD